MDLRSLKGPLLTPLVLASLIFNTNIVNADDNGPRALPGTASMADNSPTTIHTVLASAAQKFKRPKIKIQEANSAVENPQQLDSPLVSIPATSSFGTRMNEVIAQNGGRSNDPLFACDADDYFCLSGLLDLDGKYFDRKGNAGTLTAFAPGFASSQTGVGLRPVFGYPIRTFTGSMNNANLFVDLKIPALMKIHTNLAYVNGSTAVVAYQAEWAADYGSVYRLPAALKVDELYLSIANADVLPIYFKVGRMYSEFGDYDPNGYGISTIVPSLTQLMTQNRTGAGQLGIIMPYGFYASGSISYAEQSIGRVVDPTGFNPHRMNFSGKLGLRNTFYGVATNINISAIDDIRDVDYISDTIQQLNFQQLGYTIAPLYVYATKKKGGAAFHADFYMCPFGLSFEGATTFGKMSPRTFNPSFGWDSHLYTAGVEGKVDFKTFDHDSNFKLGYQIARHTQIIETNNGAVTPANPNRVHNILPEHRWQVTYDVNLIQHLNLGITWVRDHDFDIPHNGIAVNSNEVVARLDVEF